MSTDTILSLYLCDIFRLLYCEIFRHSSSVKSWILSARFAEAEEMAEEGSVTSLRPEVGVRARLRLVQTRSRTVMNICDSLQR